MKPYSQDIRERVVHALEAQEQSQAEVARRFGVSVSFVEKLWRRWRTTGSCAALPHAGGCRPSLEGHRDTIRGEVDKQPDITLEELCERVVEAGGAKVTLKTMCIELKRLRLPRKKSRSIPVSVTHRG